MTKRFEPVEHYRKLGWWYVKDKNNCDLVIGVILDGKHFRPNNDCPDLTADDLRELAEMLAAIPPDSSAADTTQDSC
jgi:hypothetical protein